jgi:alanine racemase
MGSFLHRSWAEIDLDNLEHNYKIVRDMLSDGTDIMAVVKADGYGHGSELVSLYLQHFGADWFGVSNLNEAEVLRKAGIKKPILVLGYTPPKLARIIRDLDVSQTVTDLEYAQILSKEASISGKDIKIHIKVDTGMSRLGFRAVDPVEASIEIEEVCHMKNLIPTGIFTHFASADKDDEESRSFTENQHAQFAAVVSGLFQRGISFKCIHCCNSAGIINYPESHHTMVRQGILLYGLSPISRQASDSFGLKPVMSLKSAISQIKTIEKGSCIGYGCSYIAKQEMTIATVPLGYADGYPRVFGNKAKAWIADKLVNIVGNICMDQLMLDVTGLDVKRDDVVTFFGGRSPISLCNLAGMAGTINYELSCNISRRIPRIYIKSGKVIKTIDYSIEV